MEYTGNLLRCSTCGSWTLSPEPSTGFLERLYSPNYFEDARSSESPVEADHQGELDTDWVLRILKRCDPGTFVDWGCGTGSLVAAVAATGRRSIGVEVDTTHVLELRRRGLEVTSLDDISDYLGQCAVLHLADVLEHVPSPFATLSSALRLLKPGGIVLIQGPLEGDQDLFAKVIRLAASRHSSSVLMPPWHLHQFSLIGFQDLLARVGINANSETRVVSWPAPSRLRHCKSWRTRGLFALRQVSTAYTTLVDPSAGNRVLSVGTLDG